MATELKPRLFTADEYQHMIEARVFGDEERLELIDGEIVQMSPIGPKHAACVRRLLKLLSELFADSAIVDVQSPIIVGPMYAPQPDATLLRSRPDFYAQKTPTAADCLLVIEVGDTSADFDRRVKMPRYARDGVAELWLVDLDRDVVMVYRDPDNDGTYRHLQVFRREDSIEIAALPGTLVPVQDIIG